MHSVILEGVGSHIPANSVTNEAIINRLKPKKGWDDKRIEKLTGIKTRNYIGDETLAYMAKEAVTASLKGCFAPDVDAIFYVGNTIPAGFRSEKEKIMANDSSVDIVDLTPELDNMLDSFIQDSRFNDTLLQRYHGGCAHYLTALGTAYEAIGDCKIRSAVVVTATDISRCLDFSDSDTTILFGDGASAIYLRVAEDRETPGIMRFYEKEDSDFNDLLYYEKKGENWYVRMTDGRKIYAKVIGAIGDCIDDLEENVCSREKVNKFIFHQANKRVIGTAMKKYGIPEEKAHFTIQQYGNTSSASVGITLDDALLSGVIEPGDKVMLCSFGAGFRWNYMLVQY